MDQRIDCFGFFRRGQTVQEVRHGGSGLLRLWVADEGAEELRREGESSGAETRSRPGD
jgi:hypothetical protein